MSAAVRFVETSIPFQVGGARAIATTSADGELTDLADPVWLADQAEAGPRPSPLILTESGWKALRRPPHAASTRKA